MGQPLCPNCREPFYPFLRGQVVRFDWFGLRKRIYCLICWACKEIVGHEDARGRGEMLCATCKGKKRTLVVGGTNGESEPCRACRGVGQTEIEKAGEPAEEK
jgi:hypothetical protein